ncbi:hypothetical protein KHA80_13085 [Anaerobacillus sp. HL2]|nr:hypothetical protein KHA80_13085 [Anaerobacillus sp. HL2]
MEKDIEIMKMSVELSETILEGLQHIQKVFRSESFETIFLFEDVLLAYSTIETQLNQSKKN